LLVEEAPDARRGATSRKPHRETQAPVSADAPPPPRRAARQKRGYADVSERQFMKMLQEGVDARPIYRAVGPNAGEMKVRLRRCN